jgi:hypothetical protein
MNRPRKAALIFLVLGILTDFWLDRAEPAASDEQQPEQRPAIESVPNARPRTDAQLRQTFMRGIAEELEEGKYANLVRSVPTTRGPGHSV